LDQIITLRDMINPASKNDFEDVYMVFDFMETDMHKIIYSKNDLTDDHCQYFAYQMLRGLRHIHGANVLHRDLKPSNLLLNGNCDLKICDFGLARGVSGIAFLYLTFTFCLDLTVVHCVISRAEL
jgi:mitogen-activated protein kinase 1/3